MSPQGEETIEVSLARINAGLQSINAALQSTGSPEVFEQYKQGVYLNKPFGRTEHAHEVARALGEGQGYASVERDKDPNQNDQYWVRLLKPNEITNDMLPNATGVMDEMRRLEHAVSQKSEPAEPQSEVEFPDFEADRRRHTRPNAHRRGRQHGLIQGGRAPGEERPIAGLRVCWRPAAEYDIRGR